jgi:hypothetical protein
MRATAILVLSYRIDLGTPPKNVNARTCPSQNASVVSAGYCADKSRIRSIMAASFAALAAPVAQRRSGHRKQRAGPSGRETTLPATQLDVDELARSPVFCRDFLHDLDLEVAFGNQLLQPNIIGLELLEAPHFVRLDPPNRLRHV